MFDFHYPQCGLPPYVVRLVIPGPVIRRTTILRAMTASKLTQPVPIEMQTEHSSDYHNAAWIDALNSQRRGDITHLAMMHSDVAPRRDCPWLDILIAQHIKANVSFLSCAIAMKDKRYLLSCGVLNDGDFTSGLKYRLPISRLKELPNVFMASHLGYRDQPLAHNTGLWLADLRDDRWRTTDPYGDLAMCFESPKRVRVARQFELGGGSNIVIQDAGGQYILQGESEDYNWSRRLHRCGIPSAISQGFVVWHTGDYEWSSHDAG